MTKPSRFLGSLVCDWHEEHYIAAVIDNLDQAEQAVSELELAGWKAYEVRLFLGTSAIQKLDVLGDHCSLPARIAAALRSATSDEGSISARYEAEAERGHQILAVYADASEQVERAHAILARHRAHAIEYFGSWAITDLPAQEEIPKNV